ncbi:MAG: hybrid sensor histidine kinase/response regulator [Oculatellaceae cyanobacterium bins.114]|nr:hybrid sensor histidine kinase/response regulator [Oculatellaceae cyanobacterium bins.114]
MMQTATILVVDDEPSGFTVVKSLLTPQGYNISCVSSAQDAFTQLETALPDVILLDVMMPEMDGIEACRLLKAHPDWQHIPVIIVTALNSKSDLVRCIEAGADDFITKPVNGLELRSRVRSMLRIKHQYDALQSTLSLREDLSHMIVHDLRNPLASILLAAEILKRFESSDRQQQKIEQIVIAGQQMQSLIDSLLLMAKLESGKMILRREDTDLNAMCSAAIALIEPLAAQKKLELIADLPEPNGRVSIDINIFRRVLDNLLSNSIKFAPFNSQVILKVSYPRLHQAQIQVIDFGPGVPEDLRQSIFEKYQVGKFVKEVPQIGLGLAFCKMAVEAHGGQITVETNQPKGSIFTISLP